MSNEKVKEHIVLQYLLENNPELLQKLVENPNLTLKELGFSEESLRCPEEAHEVLKRVEDLTNRLESIATDPVHDLPKVAQLIREYFGNSYEVSKMPFGIQFREKAKDVGVNWTITGSINWLFGTTKGMFKFPIDLDG